MRVHLALAAVVMMAAAPALADAPTSTAAQNASNWDTFLKLYPARALAAHEEGAVGFSVTIDRSGGVTQCQVTHSSGHPLLDQETCNLITLHAQFQPEQGLSGSQVRTHQGVINWKLPASTTQLAAPQAVASSGLDKVVCKKTVRIGTLAGFERTCMTVREWNHESDEMKATWEDAQGKKGATSGHD
jgi:TonB family protein